METRRLLGPAVGLLLLAAGCDRTGGGDASLPVGRYLYVASHPVPAGEDSIRLRGVLEITESEPDGVEGRWDVPQLHPELESLGAERDGLVVTAHPTYFGTILHRVRTGAAGAIACEGEYTWVAEGGEQRSLPLRCALDPNVPEGYDPAVPYPESPVIRPIDADTLPPAPVGSRP